MGSSPTLSAKFKFMSKIDKKRIKLQEEIDRLEGEMRKSLTQKTSNTKEISVSDYLTKIGELRKKLN